MEIRRLVSDQNPAMSGPGLQKYACERDQGLAG